MVEKVIRYYAECEDGSVICYGVKTVRKWSIGNSCIMWPDKLEGRKVVREFKLEGKNYKELERKEKEMKLNLVEV